MTFPQTPLDIGAELLIDGVWTDITSDVRAESGISLSRGRSSEGAQIDPASCTLTLQNGWKYTTRNPRSPYYGLLSRNTPMRIVVNEGDAQADFPGTVGNKTSTPDTAALDITGDLDVRFEIAPYTWNSGFNYELIGKWIGTGNQRSWYITGGATGALNFHWSTTGSNELLYTGTTQDFPTPDFRQAFRVTLDVNNGSGGYTLTYYRADTMDGPWEQYEQKVTTSGTTSIFASTAPLEIGDITSLVDDPLQGSVFKAEVRSGIGGTVVAAPDFTAQTPGVTSFTDTAGLVWTMAGGAALTNRRVRLWGEVAEWPPRWQPGGFDVTVPITVSGYFRRLKTGATALQSPLRRSLPSADHVLAYWPMEDAKGATQASSPLPGVRPMKVTGATFEADTSLPGSDALPTFADGSTFSGRSPLGAGGGWTAAALFKVDSLPAALTELWQVTVTGSGLVAAAVSASATRLQIEGRDWTGSKIAFIAVTNTAQIADFIGKWNILLIRAENSGSDTLLYLTWIDALTVTGWEYHTTLTNTEPGDVYAVSMPSLATDFDGLTMGHVSVFDASATTAYYAPSDGFSGETAVQRFARVTTEEGVHRVSQPGAIDRAPQMVGPQQIQTLFEIVQSAADADQGILYEERDDKAIQYRSHITLESQVPHLVVAYEDVADPLEPTDDDQGIENDVTVSRDGGSSARVEQLTDTLNVQEPEADRQGVGRYAASYTLNLATDDQTDQLASWLMHVGTWDEARYPVVRVNLARNPELITAATRVDIGDRIQITDLPDWLPPGPIDLLVQGYKESMDQFTWTIEYNCTPYGPWLTGVVGDPDYGRADTEKSLLAEDVTSTATTLSVSTVDGPVWTADLTDLPLDIRVGGEVMTVTSITGDRGDRFERSVTSGWGTATSGQTWSTSGGSASDFSVQGG